MTRHNNGYEPNGKGSYAFCIVCKEKIGDRFKVKIHDSVIKNTIKAHICRDCFNSFMESYYSKNIFSTSKFISRLRNRNKDIRI